MAVDERPEFDTRALLRRQIETRIARGLREAFGDELALRAAQSPGPVLDVLDEPIDAFFAALRGLDAAMLLAGLLLFLLQVREQLVDLLRAQAIQPARRVGCAMGDRRPHEALDLVAAALELLARERAAGRGREAIEEVRISRQLGAPMPDEELAQVGAQLARLRCVEGDVARKVVMSEPAKAVVDELRAARGERSEQQAGGQPSSDAKRSTTATIVGDDPGVTHRGFHYPAL
jgi:hypothetical protein